MKKGEDNIKLKVVHLGHDNIISKAAYIENESINIRVLDPSSSIRAERYPIPSSFNFRSHQVERDFA